MGSHTIRSEMERLFNEVQMADSIVFGRIESLVSNLQAERDMLREKNKRLTSENIRLNGENGKKCYCF